MIIEWLAGLWTGFAGWIVDVMPDWTPPDWLTGLPDQVNSFLANLNGVGVWADWPFILGVVAVVLAVWVTALTVKTARALVSYLPFFGGAG